MKVGLNWGTRVEKKDKETGEVTIINPDGMREVKLSNNWEEVYKETSLALTALRG
jgi:hypothetical protein